MKADFLYKLGAYLKRKAHRLDRKILIYLFFLCISAFLWLMSALSKQYTTLVKYPVTYINYPETFAPVHVLPSYLELKISGYGNTLLQYKISTPSNPIVIDLKKYFRNHSAGKNFKFYVVTRSELDKINSQISSLIQLVEINPDTLFFEFAYIVKRQIRVKPNLEVTYTKQAVSEGNISCSPERVLVSGPSSILDTLSFISTRLYKFEHLSRTTTSNLELEKLDNINFEPGIVKVTIPVEKNTEASVNVLIEVINIPKGIQMHTFPKNVKISFSAGLSKYKKISFSDFRVCVDYKMASKEKGNKVEVQLLKYPEFLSSVSYYPQSVEFLIEK